MLDTEYIVKHFIERSAISALRDHMTERLLLGQSTLQQMEEKTEEVKSTILQLQGAVSALNELLK